MRITMIGAGYVGLVSGACFAQAGHHVTCVDIDQSKIDLLSGGGLPIFEPGLADVIADGRRQKRLSFCSDVAASARTAEVIFIAVGTPSRAGDGYADLTQVYCAIHELAPALKQGCIVVIKSTVPVATGDEVARLIAELRPGLDFDVASNPEFLRAGKAVEDFKYPDRVVIGAQTPRARQVLASLYRATGIEPQRIMLTDRRSSELIKYAANGFLATKIAFVNELADLCEKVDASIGDVALGMGLDHRIGSHYLSAGPGFGGSCFPKDAQALAKMGEDNDSPMRIIETVLASNEARKRSMGRRVARLSGGSLRGKTICLLGLTFKAGTDDMRDAPSIPLVHAFLNAGAVVKAYDPVGMSRARGVLPSHISYCATATEAAAGAHAIVIATEWKEFERLDFDQLRNQVAVPLVIDLRNILNVDQLARCGFDYVALGSDGARPAQVLPITNRNTWRQSRDSATYARTGNREKISAAE